MGRVTYPSKNRDAFADLNLGIRVDRATATLPQGASAAIFNVNGGRVLVTAIIGQVTTILGAVGNMKLIATPTTGVANDMCAVVAAGTFAVGVLVNIDGIVGDAMISGTGSVSTTTAPVVVNVGTINLSLSGSSTGSMKWTICYVPFDDGAYVTAA